MIRHVARRWGDASDKTDAIFAETHLATDFSRAMAVSLMPGPHLDEQNLRMANRALIDVKELMDAASTSSLDIGLLNWTRHAAMQASSCGVYGNNHPFVDADVASAFWFV